MGIEHELAGISTPDRVTTSIGEMTFFDGVPSKETAAVAYDYIDRAHGVEVFLNAMPGASVYALVKGPEAIGVSRVGQVMLFDGLMDSALLAQVKRIAEDTPLQTSSLSPAPVTPKRRPVEGDPTTLVAITDCAVTLAVVPASPGRS